MSLEKILDKISNYEEEMIQMQKDLVSIPALSPENGGDGEAKKAEFLKSWIKENLKSKIIEINAPDKRVSTGLRPNIATIIEGKNPDKTIWIMTHTDVVPAGDLSKWKNDPFTAWIEDGKIFGRGTEDNQQEMVASLFAAKALVESGIKPKHNIGILLVADEETGSKYGISYVLKVKKELFKKDDLIIVPDAGDPEGKTIEVAEKGILWIKFKIIGKQTHASTPDDGINAHRAGAHLIVKLDELKEYFNKKDPLFSPQESTFEPTKKDSNVPNINTIPGEDVFYFDCRILPEYSIEKVIERIKLHTIEIEKKFGVKIEMEFPQKEDAAPPTSPNSEVVKTLSKAIKKVKGIEPETIGIGGGTVAAIFRRHGYNAAVWATQDEVAHEANEYSIIKNMVEDSKVYGVLFTGEF